MAKLNTNSLHGDEDVLHCSQLIRFNARQSGYLFHTDWLEFPFTKANCALPAKEDIDNVFLL